MKSSKKSTTKNNRNGKRRDKKGERTKKPGDSENNTGKDLEGERGKTKEKLIKIQQYLMYWHKVTTEDLPKYLYGKMKRKDRCLIARYKYGNELKENQHWKEIEDKTYKVCENGKESLMHVLRECQATRSNIQIEFLSKERKGLDVMRRIEQERRKKQGIEVVRLTLYYY